MPRPVPARSSTRRTRSRCGPSSASWACRRRAGRSWRRSTTSSRSVCRACSRRRAAAMTARASGSYGPRPTPPRRSRPMPCSPRSSSTSAVSCRRRSLVVRPARPSPIPWSSRARRTGSARRSSLRRPTSPPISAAQAQQIADRRRRGARRHRHARGRAVRDQATGGCSSTSSRCARTTPGHWTIDGAATSQFENHLRGVLDLPLGPSTPTAPWSVMYNVLGGAVDDLEAQVAHRARGRARGVTSISTARP